MDTVNIGLIGLGTIGQGVYKIIQEHQKELVHQTGFEINIKQILVRHVEKKRSIDIPVNLLTSDTDSFLQNPDIDMVIEAAGGVESTRQMLTKALKHRKHIITANKDLMALYGTELMNQAKENHCDFFYEASVGGGIPIIRSLVDGLASDRIREVAGIINGTTNYILTKMDHDHMSYESALKKAQELGFAEPDPTSDVEGFDAGRKIAILATLAFSMPVNFEDVRVKGITGLSDIDLAYAKKLGYEMKLLGITKIKNGAIEASVEPTLLPHAHPLTSVHDEYNAVMVKGEAVGTTMFYGPGAGSLPTATAIVSDVVTVVKNIALGTTGMHILVPQFEKKMKAAKDIHAKYFMRLEVKDQVGVFASVTELFAKHGISFERIIQDTSEVENHAEIIIVTHDISLEALNATLSELGDVDSVVAVKSYYRIEHA